MTAGEFHLQRRTALLKASLFFKFKAEQLIHKMMHIICVWMPSSQAIVINLGRKKITSKKWNIRPITGGTCVLNVDLLYMCFPC